MDIDMSDLMTSMRKCSVKNQMDIDVIIELLIIQNNEQIYKNDHFMPAKESGWIPFFVSGILHITLNGKNTSIDISDAEKEYVITIAPDGSLNAMAN